MRNIRLKFIVLTFALISSIFVFGQKKQISDSDMNDQLTKFANAMQLIRYMYVDTINEVKLVENAIIETLKKLDPHSYYISKEELEKANEPIVGSFEGVGVSFQLYKDTLLVIAPIPGGPSEKVGIRAGDKILEIDGDKSYGDHMTNKFVFDHLRGKKGTKVNIKVFRKGWDNLIDYVIVRDKIPINSIDATFMATDDVGYIRLNRFSLKTFEEYKHSIESLKKQGMKKLILDLRGNPGGVMQAAIEICDDLLNTNKLIVYTEGIHSQRRDYKSTPIGRFEKGRLVVLIDEGSASASEIVAGAIQDWDRGLILGRRSFGKGLVQNPFPLIDGSAIRLTVARYYTPSGRCIQRSYANGIEDYYKKLYDRYTNGEMIHSDSINFPDSLKYNTAGMRTVYGGGGIMPDIFIPMDTTDFSVYRVDLVRKGVFNDFVINYIEKQRKKLETKYPDYISFNKNFKLTDAILKDFTKFGVKQGVKFDEKGFNKSKIRMGYSLKALIARNLWNMDAYHYVMSTIDDVYKKAIEVLEDTETFKSLSYYKK
jgi:carboxyl-terminal processing protease